MPLYSPLWSPVHPIGDGMKMNFFEFSMIILLQLLVDHIGNAKNN